MSDKSNEQSKYLYGQYEDALGEQLKPNKSQYVLPELEKNPKKENEAVKSIQSEYILHELQQQDEKNPNVCREAPHRPTLIGTPINAKVIRAQIESLDNAIVTPTIVNGKVFFTTHGDEDTKTAIEGSLSNPRLNEASSDVPAAKGVNLEKVKFTFPQLVRLLGQSTCDRLEREFVKQNQLSDNELAQLRTARESVSELAITAHTARSTFETTDDSASTARTSQSTLGVVTANSLEPNLLSAHTANSLEPNLLSVYSARSPGLATRIFAKSPGIKTANELEPNLLSTRTANSIEPNLLSVRTANSVEPNLLSVYSARSPGLATKIFAQSPGIHTANELEPNLLSTRTANSVEPNLLSVKTSRSPGLATKIFAQSPGILTAQVREPNLLSVQTARSSSSNQSMAGAESKDVATCIEYNTPTIGVSTAKSDARSSKDVNTAVGIDAMHSSQDVATARLAASTGSSQDVKTAMEILTSMKDTLLTARELDAIRSSQDVKTAVGIDERANEQQQEMQT